MIKTHFKTGALLVVCSTFMTGCMAMVMHQHKKPDPAEFLDSADTNHDGVVSRPEFDVALVKRFASLDRNSDGFIDLNDLPARLRSNQTAEDRISNLIDRFDTDGDGRISKTEFVGRMALVFDRADKDHNGVLSADELAAAKAAIRKRRSDAE